MKKTVFIVIFAFSFLIVSNVNAQVQTATLSLSPSSGSYTVGSNFTLNINLNTGVNNTDGVDIHYLNYNPALLEVQDANSGTAGVQIQAGSLYDNTNTNLVNTTNGRIDFSQTSGGGATYSGSGVLASITFKVLAAGTANLTFNFTSGVTTDSNVACSGQDVLNSVTNGSYTLAVGADTQAPQISGLTASDIGQTSAKISWTTDENSTSLIEYGLSATYGSATSSLDLIASHSIIINGLSSATTYHYRVKSEDASNNEAVSADTTFITASPPVENPPAGGGGGGGGGGGYTPPDTISPSISEVEVKDITQTSATINWKTNETALSQIEYGETSALGQATAFGVNYLTSHAVTVSNLKLGATYYYRLISKDLSGNNATFSGNTFTTATPGGSGSSQSNNVGSVEGKITINSLVGTALSGAQIILTPNNYKTDSLVDGSYKLDNVAVGVYSLKVSKNGYIFYEVEKININQSNIAKVNVYLKEDGKKEETALNTGKIIIGSGFMAYASHLRGGYFVSSGNVLNNDKTEIVTGTGEGFGPQVSVFDEAGNPLVRFFAYQKHLRGGIRVAVGDLDGDGIDEIITGSGPGGTPHIQIFNGEGKRLTPGFWALDGKFKGGVFVACGDINGDGKDEIIVTAGKGGGAHVMAYDKDGKILLNFFAYDQYTFKGGIYVATADLNGDSIKEIVTVPEVGSTHIQSFSNKGKRLNPGFYAFDQKFKGGASISGGDINGDGKDEIIIGIGKNGGSQIRILNEREENIKDDFFVYQESFVGGVNVGTGDIDKDGKAEVLVFPRSMGGPDLRIIKL